MTPTRSATPIVLVPGIQGRWEWMHPAIQALKARHDVMTFSLGEVSGQGLFDKWTSRIDALLDTAGCETAAVVGVSFGGLVATWYAAQRPRRASHLVLAATPAPAWRPDEQTARYLGSPVLSAPFFALRSVSRLAPELASAIPGLGPKIGFGAAYALRALRYPASPRKMAAMVHEWRRVDLRAAARQIVVPTLVITGEDDLDLVVPVSGTLEYLTLIPGSVHVRLPRTGHLGCVTRPHEFAAVVTDFLDAS
jgi:pimeloyl-ACP methyl ester carboxylesterase